MRYFIYSCIFLIFLFNLNNAQVSKWKEKVQYGRSFIDQGLEKCNQSVKVKEKHCLNAVKKMCLSYNVFDKTPTTPEPVVEITTATTSQQMNGWRDKVSFARKIIEQYFNNCLNSVKVSERHCRNALKKTCIDRQLLSETGEDI
jgi:hypothetical protein